MNELNNKLWNESTEGKKKAAEAEAMGNTGRPLDGKGAAAGGDGPMADSAEVGEGSAGTEGEAPKHWLHIHLLTFALFGPLSFQHDDDLSLTSSDGPTRKLSTASPLPEDVDSSSGSASPVAGIESPECIKLLAPPNKKMSRREIKKAQKAAIKMEEESGGKPKMVDVLERQHNERQEDMAKLLGDWRESRRKRELTTQASIKMKLHDRKLRSIRRRNKAKLRTRKNLIKSLQAEVALAIDTGDDEELAAVRKKLKVALSTQVQLEESPDPLPEDYDAALSMSAFQTTEATPTGPAPMAATPPAIGTDPAPNAEVAESIHLTDIATTSWGGVPGSPTRTKHSPSREAGLPPGWAPTPVRAAPASVTAAKSLGGGVAGPTPARATPASVTAAKSLGGDVAGPTPARAAPASVAAATSLGRGVAGPTPVHAAPASMTAAAAFGGGVPGPTPVRIAPASMTAAAAFGGGVPGPTPVRAALTSVAAATAFGGNMPGPTPVRAAPAAVDPASTLGGGTTGPTHALAAPASITAATTSGGGTTGPTHALAAPASITAATTSGGGMAGSTVPEQRSPLRGSRSPGWPTTPGHAAPASSTADTRFPQETCGSSPSMSSPASNTGRDHPAFSDAARTTASMLPGISGDSDVE